MTHCCRFRHGKCAIGVHVMLEKDQAVNLGQCIHDILAASERYLLVFK
jgi:hypothetical protein